MAPAPGPPPSPKPNFGDAWDTLRGKANAVGGIIALFAFLVLVGGAGGYFWSQSRKQPAAKPPSIETLSQDEINKLNSVGANLGTSGQTLNIGANSLFRGKVDIGGALSVGGPLNANGPVTLSQLNITGTTAATGLVVGSNLRVAGLTTLQNGLTVTGLATINGGLNVSGSASVNSLNALSIAVRNISISGPLTISHLVTQGTTPIIAAGQVGAGGTVSISGNDTSGTININTGTGPGTTLATITFRAAYGSTTHVQLTPIADAANASQTYVPTYVTRSSTGFQIHTYSNSPLPPNSKTLSFDYLVTQ